MAIETEIYFATFSKLSTDSLSLQFKFNYISENFVLIFKLSIDPNNESLIIYIDVEAIFF